MYEIIQKLIPPGKGIRGPKRQSILTPRGMAWHWTANLNKGAGVENHWKFCNRSEYGAQYYIDSKTIAQFVPDIEVTWHAGPGRLFTDYIRKKYPSGANSSLIGVEMCVNSDGDWEETYQRAVFLGAVKCIEYGWDPHKNFERHFDCTGKDCPRMMTKFVSGGEAAWLKFREDVSIMVRRLNNMFTDIENHWARVFIEAAAKDGIIRGGEDGRFRPNDPITRAETVVIVTRAIDNLKGKILRGELK